MGSIEMRLLQRIAEGNEDKSGLHVYYNLDLNLPFFKRKFAGEGLVVDICEYSSWWCDPRPATRADMDRLRVGVESLLGPGAWRFIESVVSRGLVMVNTDDAGVGDQVWEFFVNGVKLGTLFYHIVLDRPVFIPGPLASRLLVDGGILRVVEECGSTLISSSEVVVVECRGIYRGVAVPVKGSSLALVIEDRYPDDRLVEYALSAPRRTLREVYEANLEHIELLVAKTGRVVEWLEGRLGRRGVLGFSGGKDSLLALHLLVENGSNVVAFYSHIEHGDPPHIHDYVERVASRLGVDLILHYNTWSRVERMLRAFGMPVRGYRWCTQVFKISPLMNFLHRLGRDSVVSYTGARSYETVKRGLKPATYVDVEHGVLVHMVPYKWPRFLEMLALQYRYRAELPRDYDAGFERISCVICPNKTLFELRLSEKLYPGDFDAWLPYIRDVATQISPSCIDCVLRYHSWRFMMQPSELRSISEVAGFVHRLRLPGPRRPPRRRGEDDEKRLEENLALAFPNAKVVDGRVFSGECVAKLDDPRGVWLEKGGFDKCSALLKLVYATLYCVDCKLCIPRCPYDAVSTPLRLDPSRCKAPECNVCYATCPLAWAAVDLALANMYLGYRRALWRLQRLREARGREYVEKAKRAEEEVYRTKGSVGEGGAATKASEKGSKAPREAG